MSLNAQSRKNNTVLYSDEHFNRGRYSDGDVVIADPNGLGDPNVFTFESAGDKTAANLGATWDPSVAANAQGTGTGTGPVFHRKTDRESVRHYGYAGQSDWTKAVNDARESMLDRRHEVYINPSESSYDIGDLDELENNTGRTIKFYGGGVKNTIINAIGTGTLWQLGEDVRSSPNEDQDWRGFELHDMAMVTDTAAVCFGMEWRYPGAKIANCHIEGFGKAFGSNRDISTDPDGPKSWDLEVNDLTIVYCGTGIETVNHAGNFTKVWIQWCEKGLVVGAGSSTEFTGGNITGCKDFAVQYVDALSGSVPNGFVFRDNYVEMGYQNGPPVGRSTLNFGSNRTIALLPSVPFFTSVGQSLNNVSIQNNTIQMQFSDRCFEIDLDDAGTQRTVNNVKIFGNSIGRNSSAATAGTLLSIQNYENASINNFSYHDNYTSEGVTASFSQMTNMPLDEFATVQRSMNDLRRHVRSNDVLQHSDFKLTKDLQNWTLQPGTAMPEVPYTEIIEGITVATIEDAQTTGNAEHRWIDTNNADCYWYAKIYLNGEGSYRINRRQTSGTNIVTVNKTTGAVTLSGSSGIHSFARPTQVVGNWVHVWVLFPAAADYEYFDQRPRTSGVGKTSFAEFELYAPAPVASASSFASDHGADMVLSGDAITITNTVDKDLFYMIDTEGAVATDNLSAINGGIPGQTLTLMTKDIGRSIIAIDSVNLSLSPANNTDFPMNSDSDVLQLICKSAGVWKTLSFPQNHT